MSEAQERNRAVGTHYFCNDNYSASVVLVQLDCGCVVPTEDDEDGNICYQRCKCEKGDTK